MYPAPLFRPASLGDSGSLLVIVIPVFNRAHILGRTLDTVAHQSVIAPVIIVDDGSSDNSLEVAEAWCAESPCVSCTIIRQSNGGASSARNTGLGVAIEQGYKWALCLDSDDLLPEDIVERFFYSIRNHPEHVCHSADYCYLAGNSGYSEYKSTSGCSRPLENFFNGTVPLLSATVFSLSAYRRIGGFDARYRSGQDTDFFLRMTQAGGWGWVAGAAVIITRDDAGPPEAGGHLSQLQGTARVRYQMAVIHERFLSRHDIATNRAMNKRVSRHWRKAAVTCLHSGAYMRALVCVRCAAGYRVERMKCLLLYIRIFIAGARTGLL